MFSFKQKRPEFQFIISFDIFSQIATTETFIFNRFPLPFRLCLFLPFSKRTYCWVFFHLLKKMIFSSQAVFLLSLSSEFTPRLHKLPSCTPLTSLSENLGAGGGVPLEPVIGLKFTNYMACIDSLFVYSLSGTGMKTVTYLII